MKKPPTEPEASQPVQDFLIPYLVTDVRFRPYGVDAAVLEQLESALEDVVSRNFEWESQILIRGIHSESL